MSECVHIGLATSSGGSRNKAMGGAVILEGRHILERALAPPPPSPPQGRRKVYMIGGGGGGLPKAKIIKFMNFNGGICSPYSLLSSAGVGGGGGGGGVTITSSGLLWRQI